MEPNPDRGLYAEQVAWARARFIRHLPHGDPLRAALLTDADPADVDWAALVVDDRGLVTIHHPPSGPAVRYQPLERLYQAPFDDPARVVVAQAGDGDDDPDTRLDAASVYIEGQSVASMVEGIPTHPER